MRDSTTAILLAGQPIRSRSTFVVPTTLYVRCKLSKTKMLLMRPSSSGSSAWSVRISVLLEVLTSNDAWGRTTKGYAFQLTVVVLNGSSHGNVAWTGYDFHAEARACSTICGFMLFQRAAD